MDSTRRQGATMTGPVRLARRARDGGNSMLRAIMGKVSRPGVLSLAHGMPAAELFPSEDLSAVGALLWQEERRALQYGMPSGDLRTAIVELMRLRGVDCRPEQIFLTAGAQQAMRLICRLLVDPGQPVLLEETVYDGFQVAVRDLGPRILPVPTRADRGIDVDVVQDYLERGERPAFLYLIPEGHNPLGASLSPASRGRLIELARAYGLPLLEDDAYGLLSYADEPQPALRSLDDRWVFYLGSFSKVLAPGLRTGWAVVPEEMIEHLSRLKHASDIDTQTFSQILIARYLEMGRLGAHVEKIRAEYRRRRDALLAALERHFPAEASWNRPEAGMFVWVDLPETVDAVALLDRALEEEGVGFSPGAAFALPGSTASRSALRLCFSTHPPEVLEEAVRRLGRVLQSAGARSAGT